LHKYWKDKKKEKYDERRKGLKPPLIRNSPSTYWQDHPTKNESKREESLGKMGIPPIKCWVCKEGHMYKNLPHIEDTMRTLHNIQEATTLEDMGENI